MVKGRSATALGVLVWLAVPAWAMAQTREEMDEARLRIAEAFAARDSGDVAGSIGPLEQALELRPGHPEIHMALAGGLASTGRIEAALEHLETVAAMGLAFQVDDDEDFGAMRSDARFRRVVEDFEVNAVPRGRARDFVTVPVEPDFIPEGFAHDPVGGAFFLGSVRKRKILELRPGQEPRVLAPSGFQGLASVMGMVVDPTRRHLWVCSTGLAQTEGLSEDQRGRSSVFQFDVDTGALLVTFHFPPGEDRERAIGDIGLHSSGRIFLSDGRGSAIYTIRPGGDFMETFVQPGVFASPQGIAVPDSGRWFYVADYSRGVFRVHQDSRRVEAVSAPPGTAMLGIDELAWHASGLIAVQNGTHPKRILRLALEGRRITEVEVLASNLPGWQEPTLGQVVGDRFYFVANSQWNRFEGADLPPLVELEPPLIQWLDLRP